MFVVSDSASRRNPLDTPTRRPQSFGPRRSRTNMNRPAASRTVMLGALLIHVACGEGSRSVLPFAPSSASSSAPTASPVPPPGSSTATFWAMVVDGDSGTCIEGATVEVISGQRAGQTVTQETPCDVREYRGGVKLTELTAGVELRLRVSATGWHAQERRFAPQSGRYTAVFALRPQVE